MFCSTKQLPEVLLKVASYRQLQAEVSLLLTSPLVPKLQAS